MIDLNQTIPDPHPWYAGGCDALGPDGTCAECARISDQSKTTSITSLNKGRKPTCPFCFTAGNCSGSCLLEGNECPVTGKPCECVDVCMMPLNGGVQNV